ncbi:hypothetical protein L596_007982 [Steinernema carpocapsae]|uniref:Uncharacterized protein n=1 Tax=Steinernema carpocapsae TaxID=34508 RepID=A0A4V6A664_STECR|nr:hypothetical protein L596_007982 [Steinernema carpocapsae]
MLGVHASPDQRRRHHRRVTVDGRSSAICRAATDNLVRCLVAVKYRSAITFEVFSPNHTNHQHTHTIALFAPS